MTKSAKFLFKLILVFLILAAILLAGISLIYRLFPVKYYDSIIKYCSKFDTDEALVLSLIKAESNFNENALSNAGAKGLMQLTDDTFAFCKKHCGLSSDADILNAEDNICAGIWYLSFLLKRYNGNTKNAVAAYNAGLVTVDKWLTSEKYSSDNKTLNVVPYGETHRHIKKIMKYKKIYAFLYY